MIDELGKDHDKTVREWMASLPIPLQVTIYIDLISVKIEFHNCIVYLFNDVDIIYILYYNVHASTSQTVIEQPCIRGSSCMQCVLLIRFRK